MTSPATAPTTSPPKVSDQAVLVQNEVKLLSEKSAGKEKEKEKPSLHTKIPLIKLTVPSGSKPKPQLKTLPEKPIHVHPQAPKRLKREHPPTEESETGSESYDDDDDENHEGEDQDSYSGQEQDDDDHDEDVDQTYDYAPVNEDDGHEHEHENELDPDEDDDNNDDDEITSRSDVASDEMASHAAARRQCFWLESEGKRRAELFAMLANPHITLSDMDPEQLLLLVFGSEYSVQELKIMLHALISKMKDLQTADMIMPSTQIAVSSDINNNKATERQGTEKGVSINVPDTNIIAATTTTNESKKN